MKSFACAILVASLLAVVFSTPLGPELEEDSLLPVAHSVHKRAVVTCEKSTPYDYYVPHPTTCRLFYMCSNGVPFLMECPGDLVFDPQINVCNYPNGNCGEGSGFGP